MTITEGQQAIIDKLKSVGYGYAKFAESVEKSGKCSSKQHYCMINMLSRVEYIKNNPRSAFGKEYHPSISDSEEMGCGDWY